MSPLAKKIASGSIPPVLIVVATDPLLVRRTLETVLENTVPPGARDFNYDRIQGKDTTAAHLLGLCQTVPMMATKRMILVRDFQALAAGELLHLLPYLENPVLSTVLLCVAKKVDKRIKFYQTAKKRDYLYELSAPKRLTSFVSAEAKEQGVAISQAAQKRLTLVIGSDLARISLAVGQLALFTGGRQIEVDDVDELIANTRERSIFELSDAIGNSDIARATDVLSTLCDQRQSAIGVVIMLSRYWRQLATCAALREQKIPRGEMVKRLGVPPFVVNKLLEHSRALSAKKAARGFHKLAQTDRELKGLSNVVKTLGRPLAERVLLGDLVRELTQLMAP